MRDAAADESAEQQLGGDVRGAQVQDGHHVGLREEVQQAAHLQGRKYFSVKISKYFLITHFVLDHVPRQVQVGQRIQGQLQQ